MIIAQEIIHYIRKQKGKNESLMFKIDLEKAYDRVNWDFLQLALNEFDFPPIIINLIMSYVMASSLSLLWNGC